MTDPIKAFEIAKSCLRQGVSLNLTLSSSFDAIGTNYVCNPVAITESESYILPIFGKRVDFKESEGETSEDLLDYFKRELSQGVNTVSYADGLVENVGMEDQYEFQGTIHPITALTEAKDLRGTNPGLDKILNKEITMSSDVPAKDFDISRLGYDSRIAKAFLMAYSPDNVRLAEGTSLELPQELPFDPDSEAETSRKLRESYDPPLTDYHVL